MSDIALMTSPPVMVFLLLFFQIAKLFSKGLTNFSNSMSDIALMTSPPVMVFLLLFCAAVFAEEVAYSTNTLAALAIAAFASLETLHVFGRQSLIILVTMEVGRFKSSGLSAIF